MSSETTSNDGSMTKNFSWKGKKDFCMAQAQVIVILAIAYMGNTYPKTYPRNENHDPRMFWIMNACLAVAAACTMKREESRGGRVQLLSRAQTEEWKGWMQWAFIMYHYYRVYYVYNEIRLFVSAYVWMTGFGNFLYFDKKKDYSIERMISMWLRINYFPILLSTFLDVPLELYYVVPLHTAGFFVTMATCYICQKLEDNTGMTYWTSRFSGIGICVLVHIIFYETSMVDLLKVFSDEYYFRFQSDKYSALVGIVSALFWKKFSQYMQWAYANVDKEQTAAKWIQRFAGASCIFVWYYGFGYMTDKYIYNPLHPYVFWLGVAGWLLLRNSSKYLCELHSTALEFFGRITLETYVLQFHVFMCKNVQHIPVVIPGATANGPLFLKTANMLLCGTIFVAMAVWARKVTVTTQETVVDLWQSICHSAGYGNYHKQSSNLEVQDLVEKHSPPPRNPPSNGSTKAPETEQV
mmetsp:Transcript_23392/g.32777  ORF Transcript_23392/g.32777 Transcript_23392/m.32777 type:complete len:466 (-) Transcript_23392:262-1659(-)